MKKGADDEVMKRVLMRSFAVKALQMSGHGFSHAKGGEAGLRTGPLVPGEESSACVTYSVAVWSEAEKR